MVPKINMPTDPSELNHGDYHVTNEEILFLGYFILFLSKNSGFQINSDNEMSDFIKNCKAANLFENYGIKIQADDIIKTRAFKQLAEILLFELQKYDAKRIITFEELKKNLSPEQSKIIDNISTIANTVISQAPKIIEFTKKLLNRRNNEDGIPDDQEEVKPACLQSTVTPRHDITDHKRNPVPRLNLSGTNQEKPQTSCFSFFADLLFCCMGVERSQQ